MGLSGVMHGLFVPGLGRQVMQKDPDCRRRPFHLVGKLELGALHRGAPARRGRDRWTRGHRVGFLGALGHVPVLA